VAEWSAAHGCYYYSNAALGLTQWEPPAAAAARGAQTAPLVAYSDDSDEEEEEEGGGAEEQRFFYGDPSGAVQGPYGLATMTAWVEQGALPADTPVCVFGSEGFSALREVEPLASALPTAAGDTASTEAASADAAPAGGDGTEGAAESVGVAAAEEERPAEAPSSERQSKKRSRAVAEAAPAPAPSPAQAASEAAEPEAAASEAEPEAAAAEDREAAQKRLKALKVAELRSECERRGLVATGVKAALIARILEAL